jgi:hypothetical protein
LRKSGLSEMKSAHHHLQALVTIVRGERATDSPTMVLEKRLLSFPRMVGRKKAEQFPELIIHLRRIHRSQRRYCFRTEMICRLKGSNDRFLTVI